MAPTHQLPVQAPVLNALQDIILYQVNHHAVYAHQIIIALKEVQALLLVLMDIRQIKDQKYQAIANLPLIAQLMAEKF